MDQNKVLQKSHQSTFEKIRRVNEKGYDFWMARSLAEILGYRDYRNFLAAVLKAKEASANSGQKKEDHFVDITEMVDIGSGARREVQDIRLSRYACYLIVQNADPSKPIVALGQTYFAVQTRKQELIEEAGYQDLRTENEKRLFLRVELKNHNKKLASAAREAGVISPVDYAIFQDHGYQGLYGGLGQTRIHRKKGLKESQKILDHMGSTELAANLFRATQTEEKLKRDNIQGKPKANQTHFEVGKKVRQTIKDLGGTVPEDLPPAESIKLIEKKQKKIMRKP
jgi:DNA-damage-inducible protein D